MAARRLSARAMAGMFLIAMALIVLGFFWPWLPAVATHHGGGIDSVIAYLMAATGVIFVAGHLVLAAFILKYTREGDPEPTAVSSKVEWRWAAVPVVIMCVIAEGGVVWVGMPVFREVYGQTPEDALEIEVTGKQFEWLVRYPGPDGVLGRTDRALVHDQRNPIGLDPKDPASQDDIVTRGRLNIPVDQPVRLNLQTLDVLHSFTVPEFRVKQDLIPGFVSRAQFTPTVTGQYEIACSELCGLGHYRMRGFATVQTREEFEEWLSKEESWF